MKILVKFAWIISKEEFGTKSSSADTNIIQVALISGLRRRSGVPFAVSHLSEKFLE